MEPSSLTPIIDLSLQFKGQQKADTIIAMGNMSADLLFRLRFSSIVRCVLWMLAKLNFFQCYSPINAMWWCVCGAALSDYRVEQQYRVSYHNELSQSAGPTGRTLHQRTKEKIKECYNSITIWSQSLTGDKTQCDTCNASNYRKIHRWKQEPNATQQPGARVTEKVIRMWHSVVYQSEQYGSFTKQR